MEVWERFKRFKGKKIALYGLGTETLKFISQTEDFFYIVGLLDGFRTAGEMYGKRIIDFKSCIELGVEAVIVVARPGSCKAIAGKIAGLCRKNGIELFDVRGKNLLKAERDYFTYDRLLEYMSKEINMYDIRAQLFINRLNEMTDKSDKADKSYSGRKGNLCKEAPLCINDSYDIGYLFCAPIITDFVLWMKDYVRDSGIQNVLMCARDGYLIDKLYRKITSEEASTYFYTSRTAAIRAGVSDREDIAYVDSMKFGGSLEKNIYERFGIRINCSGLDNDFDKAVHFQEKILRRAEKLKGGYEKYVSTIPLKEGDTALFDFVSKGTTQYYLERIIPNKLTGLYFLQLEPDFMKDKKLDIVSFYKEEELEASAIYEDYYILETILTSSEPSVLEISEKGVPVFGKETRNEDMIRCSERIRRGIEDYFLQYIEAVGNGYTIDKHTDEVFLKLIHNLEIVSQEFLEMVVEDPFFNRNTGIKDIL